MIHSVLVVGEFKTFTTLDFCGLSRALDMISFTHFAQRLVWTDTHIIVSKAAPCLADSVIGGYLRLPRYGRVAEAD